MIRAIPRVALALLMLAAVPAEAAQARKKAEPPPPPPQFHVDVATRSMSLQRLVVNIPAGAAIGTASFDTLCIKSQPIYRENAFQGVPAQDYGLVFSEEAAAAGYRVPEAQTNLFGTGDAAQPELLVGAAVLSLDEKGCPIPFAGYSGKVQANMQVEWQVFDPLEKKLLFRTTTTSAAEVSLHGTGGMTYGPMTRDAARAAFRQGAKTLLADANFVAAVRDPKGGPAAEAGALFPEAAAPPPANLEIIRLRPATEDFKNQVDHLREQVVTIRTANGSGSGFYIADNLLLTNHHVIAGFQHIRIRFMGGREIAGEVVTSNAKRDVALIKTEKNAGFTGLPLRLENPDLTSQVFVIGSPLGEKNEGSVSAGIVSAYRTEKQGPFLQSDVAVTHGNSGGPMFDEKGNVIAMTDLGEPGTAVNRFIPIADALRVLEIRFKP